MAFKRKFGRKSTQRKMGVKGRKKTTKKRRGVTLASVSKRLKLMAKTIETKSGVQLISDNIQFRHNNANIISSTMMHTGNGTLDQENSPGQRIGDKITLTGVSFKMMVELTENWSDVTLRMMVVRSAKGDVPSISTLWQGASGNKMLDIFNTESYSILHTQYVKMTAPNMGNQAAGIQAVGSGYQVGVSTLSRATKIVKFFIPGRKISKNGVIQYENGSTQVKFFDFNFIIYVYSNFSTVDSGPFTYNVASLNDCFIKLHYKDA